MHKDIDALRLAFSDRARPIIFWTGAGVSAPIIPGWMQLRDELISAGKDIASGLREPDKTTYYAELKSIETGNDLWLQFDRLEKRLKRELYERTIKASLSISEKSPVPLVQQKIWELAPVGVITLNLDLFTVRAAEAHPSKLTPISIWPGRFGDALNVLREKRPFIAYPHGHLDNPSLWTFTKTELEKRLDDARYIEWLSLIFRAATVVFVGLTADDVAIGSPLARIGGGPSRAALSGHFWITPRDDMAAVDWASQNGIRVVRYENKSKIHSELLDLLQSFHAQIKTEDSLKEKPIAPRLAALPLNDNFLSPDELTKQPEEYIRKVLNGKAASILKEPNEAIRDSTYHQFLQDYGRAIHRAWYASTMPNENEFIGYFLTEEKAGGAFGTVYQGYTAEGSPIAVKILKGDNFRKAGFHRSFRRGANSLRILSERNIPGVIRFIDAAEIPPTIVMEWSDGTSLSDLTEAGRLDTWPKRVKVALELSKIINTCHALPERVLHRDIRPANIMIENAFQSSDEWLLRVLDFDLSWHKGAEDHSIMHSPAFGYLAPEQRIRGKYTTRSALVDSYGIGMTFYFIATGKNPFPDQDMHANWASSLFAGVEALRCGEWKSLPRRFARLIYSATLHDQPSRATISQIEGELDSLHTALTTDGKVALVDVIVEEFAARTEHLDGYKWLEGDSAAVLESATGLNLRLESKPGTRIIKFSASWANSGAADWNHIDRMLSQALPKMTNALEKIGSNLRLDKGKHAFKLVADFDADQVRARPTDFASALDKCLEHASAIASF